MQAAFRLGLTGGIGSGKSTVAAILAKLGATVIDADAISQALTAMGGAAIVPIRHLFGAEFISAHGALDRDRMRALVFANTKAKERLQAILHPLVSEAARQQAHAAQTAGSTCLVFDVPLLVESAHWRAQVDQVLVLDCRVETQISRVMARSGLSRPAIESIVAAQASRGQRLAAADMVVFNDGITAHALQQQVHALATDFGLSLGPLCEPLP